MAALHPPQKIDRQSTTPFLLRLFYRSGGFHRLEDFTPGGRLPAHLQIYTWQSCSIRELTHLLTSALPALLPSPAVGTRVAFRLVFPDTRSAASVAGAPARYLTKELGSVVVGEESGGETNGGVAAQLEGEADKTLLDARFVIGDYVSCAVLPPMLNGAVAPPPTGPGMSGGRGGYGGPPRGGGYGGPRENGFGDRDAYPGRRGGRGGGFPGDRDFGRGVPSGEWRRGERLPEGPDFVPGERRGGGGFRGRGRGRGGW